MDHRRLERPDQPHVLRHPCLHERLRLPQTQGREADARRPPARPCGRLVRQPGADGARRPHPARVRPLGAPRTTDVKVSTRHGRLRLRLEPIEVDLLLSLLDQLEAVVDAEAESDPVRAWLFPSAYRDDPDAAAEYRSLTEETLTADRVDRIRGPPAAA